ncbi:MAG: response regulator transcription factor [Pleurocapsa sp.]
MTIRILLADDQYLIQEGIKSILRDETEIEIVGTAKNGVEAISLAKKLRPNIVLLDIEMPKINGVEVAKHICGVLPDTKLIMLSSHNNQKYITQSLQAGASSYLLKESFVEDLKQAIYSLSRGYSYIEEKLLNQALYKIKVNNIVNSQNKATNMKKYRKKIYIPAKTTLKNQYFSTEMLENNQQNYEISKASLAPIFDLSSSDEIETADELFSSLQKISACKTKSISKTQKYRKKLALCILAIASFILSLIIF